MTYFLQILISGLVIGCIYGMAALGFTIVFNATRVINFANGEFLMLGGLVVRQGTRIDNLSSEMASGGIERSAQQALADPSSELVDLTGGDLKLNVRAAVTEDGTGFTTTAAVASARWSAGPRGGTRPR